MKKKEKKALITGITGQDGSYLAELLLSKGYEVHIKRDLALILKELIIFIKTHITQSNTHITQWGLG